MMEILRINEAKENCRPPIKTYPKRLQHTGFCALKKSSRIKTLTLRKFGNDLTNKDDLPGDSSKDSLRPGDYLLHVKS